VIVNLLEPGFPKTGGFYKSEFVEKIDKKKKMLVNKILSRKMATHKILGAFQNISIMNTQKMLNLQLN
jgi:hypothetical protein